MKKCSTYFNPPSTDSDSNSNRIKSVLLHFKVYRAYMWLYATAYLMAKKTDAVLNDPTHQNLLRDAEAQGYKMPDTKAVRASITRLRQSLEDLDPDCGEMSRRDIVRLPAETARGLYEVAMDADQAMVQLFDGIRQSDYMLYFRDMKAANREYNGPQSLQETCDAWAALWAISVLQEEYKPKTGEKLQTNWVAQLV